MDLKSGAGVAGLAVEEEELRAGFEPEEAYAGTHGFSSTYPLGEIIADNPFLANDVVDKIIVYPSGGWSPSGTGPSFENAVLINGEGMTLLDGVYGAIGGAAVVGKEGYCVADVDVKLCGGDYVGRNFAYFECEGVNGNALGTEVWFCNNDRAWVQPVESYYIIASCSSISWLRNKEEEKRKEERNWNH